jgi:FtsP/CotA-like multicopper oxidase with cupredoxin domain
MKNSTTKAMTSVLICGACLLAATHSRAAEFNLRAASFDKTLFPGTPNERVVRMWGFADGAADPTSPGPALTVPVGDSVLTINLKNDLNVPVSLVIPGRSGFVLDAPHSTFTDSRGGTRARSFVKETQPGDTVTYTWNGVQPGTYLYHSGSHPALQVQMGLYGMVKQNAASRQAYPGAPLWGAEATWIFGEIDFEVHDAIRDGTYATAVKSMIHSVPEVYLLNGTPSTVGTIPGSNLSLPMLVRMLNACYDERIPVVSGYHLEVIAEDGRLYPYPKLENAVNLPSLKTRDAWLRKPAGVAARFYDRRLLSMQ